MAPMREYPSGATRSNAEDKLCYHGYFSPIVARRFSQYMKQHETQEDGKRREPGNWKKGMDPKRYEESAIRHFFDWWRALESPGQLIVEPRVLPDGERDWETHTAEDLACAILFNVQGWLYERLTGAYEECRDAPRPLPSSLSPTAIQPLPPRKLPVRIVEPGSGERHPFGRGPTSSGETSES